MWVQAVSYDLFSSVDFLPNFQHVDLAATSPKAGFQVYLS